MLSRLMSPLGQILGLMSQSRPHARDHDVIPRPLRRRRTCISRSLVCCVRGKTNKMRFF